MKRITKYKNLVLALAVIGSSVFTVYASEESKNLALALHQDGQNVQEIKAKRGTVAEILAAQGIVLNEGERVEPSLDTFITENDSIRIIKPVEVTLVDGEKTEVKKTTYTKVEDILKEWNITLGEFDKLSLDKTEEVEAGDTISITRVEKTTETRKEEIKFSTTEEVDNAQAVGYRNVKVQGVNGEKEVSYEVIKENGKVVSETSLSEKVLTEAVNEVVTVGTYVQPTYDSQANQSYQSQGNSYYVPAYNGGGNVVLSNGNSAGEIGRQAAQEMEARTGVSAAQWEYIIARESNGQVNARNASGASGLFQTMPGWGSTSTVEGQIAAAEKAYKAQGLSAWGVRG